MHEVLIADLGGTRARFALAREGRFGQVAAQRVADHATPAPAIRAALAALGGAPQEAILAVAAPISEGRARLTNATWALDAAELAGELGLARMRLVNDLEAMAWSLPALEAEEVETWAEGVPVAGAPMAVVAPGTGLGVAAFLPGLGVLATEAGHASFAPRDAMEEALLAWLRERQGAVSTEDLLGGVGLSTLHEGIARLRGVKAPALDGAGIDEAAEAGDPVALEAVAVFWRALGGFCGDVALTLGARGGVYLAGGVAQSFAGMLPREAFLERFRDRPRMRDYLTRIPIRLITHKQPGLVGLARMAQT
ncbi:glucokinase [Roseococcus sp. SYP-B2431]|uniref:glucokinase n=1 Tax=Roseococcus sp. SYP-B2431 TaxID=2496640 RepID=UPI00104086C9|nr:glucokinase [Roseococcus sp. SYP-B2431]TCH96012.1 glucokinase [Roseococcus sp. SYP-B2431]